MTADGQGYCGSCGRPAADAEHEACRRRLAFDPPRFCAICGFRLDVQVFPDHVESSCRECRRRSRADGVSRGPGW